MVEITYEQLRNSGQHPRVHGNGFIQIDLPQEGYRMNIWPKFWDRFKTQKVYTGWHNHKFSFESVVLTGLLIHTQYDGEPVKVENGGYQMYKVIPNEITGGENTLMVLQSPERYDFVRSQKFFLPKGSFYTFPYGKFHESEGGSECLTATIMKKKHINNTISPTVLCKWTEKPDNEYSRYQIAEEELWPFIKRVFDETGDIYMMNF